MDWRNTPTEGLATSHAQRLMRRCCSTLLPISESLLRLSYDVRAMSNKKRRQKNYYDRHAKPLANVSTGEIVRMRIPEQKVWTPATCLDLAGLRSFLVKYGSTVYRRNRRYIIKTSETPVTSQTFVRRKHHCPVVLELCRLDTYQCRLHRLLPLMCRLLSRHQSSPMCRQSSFEDHTEKEKTPQQDFAIMCRRDKTPSQILLLRVDCCLLFFFIRGEV